MTTFQAVNLALKFALEVVAVAAFAYWGASVGGGFAIVLAIAAPLAAILLWARFAAPRSTTRLPLRLRAPFEIGVFTLAALALLSMSTAAAIAFMLAVVINSLLLTGLGQWEA
jgi:Protein of unknown function (DUF2568)